LRPYCGMAVIVVVVYHLKTQFFFQAEGRNQITR
jgi:hypothetical protein